MGLEKFLKIVLVGALMMCPFVMLGENTNEGSMVLSDSIAVADSVQPTVSLDADTVFADDAVAVEFVDESTRFNAKQLILPGALIAVGSLGLVPAVKEINRDIRDEVADMRDGHYFRADDYLQYLPVVSTYGLSLLGAKARHSYLDRTFLIATSYLTMGILVNGLKYTVREPRPTGARNSFPSLGPYGNSLYGCRTGAYGIQGRFCMVWRGGLCSGNGCRCASCLERTPLGNRCVGRCRYRYFECACGLLAAAVRTPSVRTRQEEKCVRHGGCSLLQPD